MVKNTPTIERSTKIRFGKNCTEDQGENTIVFNASNVQIDATQPGAVYMTPIRKRESSDYLNYKMLIYNTETKEIVDSTVPAEDILLLDLERAVINGSVTSNTVSFNHPETSVTTLSNVGVANGAPIHTLDVGTKFYVDEEGANVLTVLGDTYIQDDVIIGGNLDVRGTITSINTENTTIKDAIIEIGKGNTTSDMGLIMDRTGTNVTMGYRESVDEFVIAHTTSSATSSTITPSSELIDARVHGRLHVNSNLTVDTDTLHVDAIRDRVGINTLNPQTDLDVVGNAQVHSDFIVDTDTLFVDASTDRVGINTLTPSTDFHVQGEAYVSGNVTVDTDTFHVDTVNDRVGINTLTPSTDFHVEGDTYVSGNVDVQTNLNVLTDAVVAGNAYMLSNVVVTGNTDVQSELNVTGNAFVSSNLNAQSELNVTGNAFVSSNLNAQSELNVTGNAFVSSNLNAESELNVTGNAFVSSNLNAQSELNVTGNAYILSDAVITGNADVQTDLNVTGNAYVSSNVVVTGNVDVQTNLNVATDAIVTGNVDVQSELNVTGNAYISSNAIVTGNVDVQSELNVVGNAYVSSNVIVTGNVDVQTNLNVATDAIVTGNVDVQSELNVTGNAYISSNAIVTGNVDVQSELNVVGNAYVSSNVIVTGNVDVQTNLNVATDAIVTGNVDVQSELNVTGNAYISSNAIVTGNVDVQSELNVVGNAYVLSDAVVTGNVDVQTDLNVTGNAYVSSNVIVTGNVDVQTNLNVATDAIVTGNVDVQSELNVTGNAYISSNAIVTGNVDVQSELNVTGNAYISSNVIVTGNVDVQTDLNVIGNAYVSSNAIVTGNVDVQSELNVTGNAYVSSNVIVTGNVDVQTNLNVATDAIVTGNVDVQTDLNVIGNAYISSNAIVTGNVDVQTDLNVVGDAYVATYYGDGGLLSNVNLQVVSDHGNSTFNTIQFTNATTGMVTTSNLEVGSNISVAGLSINKMPIVGAGNFLEDSSISKVDGKIIISSDVEILGNILVDGSSYTIESNSLVINDRIIGIANNNVSHQLDVGIVIQHPGKNIALVHHGEAVEGDPHDHTFTIGYTQNTVTDNHIFNDSNLITVEILGNLITQNNLIVSETLDVSGTVTFADDLVVGAASNLFVDVSTSRVGINEATPDASLDVGGDVNIQSDVNATSKTSAALVVAGGVGVGGDVYASNVVLSGDFTVDTDTLIVNSTTHLVGINKAVPTVALDVDGDVVISNDFTVDTNTLHVDSGTDSVGINTATPSANLHVVGNVHVQNATEAFSTTTGAMTITGGLGVTANVHATQFHGDGSKLTGLVTTLEDVANNGNTMSNTIIFENETTSLVTEGSVGIANTAPIHDLDVGSNLYVDDAGSNVLYVTGNVYATRFIGDGAFLENIASNLHEITNNGNVTTNTVHFEGATSIVTTGKIGIANAAPDHELSVTGNVYVSSEVRVAGGLITNLGGLTKKTYGYSSGTITASTTPEINVVFDSELFSAKITAHLVEPTSNISVLNLDVTGGTGRNIGKGMLSIVGDQNSKHWDTVIATTDTTVTLTPSVGLLSDGTYGIFVEYTSPLGGGGVTSIDKDNTNEITFDY